MQKLDSEGNRSTRPGAQAQPDLAAQVQELNRRLRRTEEELQSALKLSAMGRLAAGIAHEMSTPAQFVGDNISFLLKQVLELSGEGGSRIDLSYLTQELTDALESSEEGVNRVFGLVRALRHCSPSESSEMTPIALEEVVKDCLALTAGQWKYFAKVETDFSPNLPPVVGVRSDLSAILLTLLINAAQSIREKGLVGIITIQTRKLRDFIELTVEDDGAGIPESIQSNLFDPEVNSRSSGHGSGHELRFVRRVVCEQHRGMLSFYSVPGRGTKFVIELPLT